MDAMIWLALGYNVPINPSKNRVYIWRKLKEYGAGYFRQGVALLPMSTANMAKFRQLSLKICEMGGEATIAELKFTDKKDEIDAVNRFREQASTEYSELMRDCKNIAHKFPKNISEDYKDSIKKAARRLKLAQSRDFFMVGANDSIKSVLEDLADDIGELF